MSLPSKWDLRSSLRHFRLLHQESCGQKHLTTALGWRLEDSFLYLILAGSRELLLESVNKERTLHMLWKCTASLIFVQNIIFCPILLLNFLSICRAERPKPSLLYQLPHLHSQRKAHSPVLKGSLAASTSEAPQGRNFKQSSYLCLT